MTPPAQPPGQGPESRGDGRPPLPRRLLRMPALVAARGYRLGRSGLAYARSLAPGGGLPEVRFFLYGDGRVGSELLVDLLDSHPRVRCESEVLHFAVRWPMRYLEGRARAAGTAAYGFKLLNYQLRATVRRGDPARLLAELVGEGWRLIHMKRANVLRQAASALVSRHRKQWHSQKGERPLTGKVCLDCRELLRLMEAIERDVATDDAAVAELPHLETVYERDLLDAGQHEATARRVFQYLGLPPSEVSTRWAKVTPKRLSDFIGNYDEVRSAVSATPFARFLDDPS